MGQQGTTQDGVVVAGVRPEGAYDLVTDVTRTGEWSPENVGGRWVGGAAGPAEGSRFVGRNRRGRARWSTVCTVVAAERGARFAFEVSAAVFPVARWEWTFAEVDGGTRVTLAWTDRRAGVRGAALRTLAPLVTGSRVDRDSTEANIRTSLANLARVLAPR
jgi:hypothetical protein